MPVLERTPPGLSRQLDGWRELGGGAARRHPDHPTDTAETTPPPTADRPGSQPNKPSTETERVQPSQPNSGGSQAPKRPARRNPPSG